jgi:hypothetical protein
VAKSADWTGSVPFTLGNALVGGSTTYRWSGRLDEVYAYQRALRDNDVRALYGLYSTAPAANQVHLTTMSAGVPGALQGAQQGLTTSTSVAFSGTGNGYNPTSYVSPAAFTVEMWFKASGSSGGALVGFTTDPTSMTTAADRLIYLNSTGKLVFGVAPGGSKTLITTTGSYNDGAWHHVVASLGAAGMKLYVDGALAISGATTTALTATGNWRWGGVYLSGWTNRPTSDYFIGTLDELSIYPTQLTDNQIARHYAANH